jgi:hypothetical protein
MPVPNLKFQSARQKGGEAGRAIECSSTGSIVARATSCSPSSIRSVTVGVRVLFSTSISISISISITVSRGASIGK